MALRASFPDFSVDAAEDIATAEHFVLRHSHYQLILLDYNLPDARGFSGLLRLRQLAPQTPIAILSANQQPEIVAAARSIGAAGYLAKAQPLTELIGALRVLLSGREIFPSDDRSAEVATMRARIAELSHAQLRVLLALADGRLNKQIAGELGVTEATIKAHMSAIFRKLGVINRTQAILAMQPLLGEHRETMNDD